MHYIHIEVSRVQGFMGAFPSIVCWPCFPQSASSSPRASAARNTDLRDLITSHLDLRDLIASHLAHGPQAALVSSDLEWSGKHALWGKESSPSGKRIFETNMNAF